MAGAIAVGKSKWSEGHCATQQRTLAFSVRKDSDARYGYFPALSECGSVALVASVTSEAKRVLYRYDGWGLAWLVRNSWES